MSAALEIALAPERLDEGALEERACFGLFTIQADGVALTAGIDWFIDAYRRGPLVSGYHAAEWFAWNWWRLRYEPRSAAPDWWRAHETTAIGEGYVWPNLTIYSDGVRTALIAQASVRPNAKPFRYLGAPPCIVSSAQFEAAVDAFMPRILGRLRARGVYETNLDRLWRDVLSERADPELAKRRRLEALLGRDADEVQDDAVARLVDDAAILGEQAVEELAADSAQGGGLLGAKELREIAARSGFAARPSNAVGFRTGTVLPSANEAPAWRLGAEAARAFREQQRLGDRPIGNDTLAQFAGVEPRVLGADTPGPSVSFALDTNASEGRVVLRSRWQTGRRFGLARLIAERIVAPPSGKLRAATRAYTYRQKMQRSFAAELLSPFAAVDAMLDGDYSPEAQQDVAAHFAVSERTILTLLVNHYRLGREELEAELGAVT